MTVEHTRQSTQAHQQALAIPARQVRALCDNVRSQLHRGNRRRDIHPDQGLIRLDAEPRIHTAVQVVVREMCHGSISSTRLFASSVAFLIRSTALSLGDRDWVSIAVPFDRKGCTGDTSVPRVAQTAG